MKSSQAKTAHLVVLAFLLWGTPLEGRQIDPQWVLVIYVLGSFALAGVFAHYLDKYFS